MPRAATCAYGLIVGADARVLAFLQSLELHRADNADDLQPFHRRPGLRDVVRFVGQVHPPADRILIRPEPRRELFVDDDDPRRVGRVGSR